MALSDQFENLKESFQSVNLSEIDADNVGQLPLVIKLIACLLVLAAIGFIGYKLDISKKKMELGASEKKLEELKTSYKQKAFEAANLQAYRDQMVEMEASFEALRGQLPSDTEVPGLLEDISNKGEASGLAFESIDLQDEKREEFYVELPIEVKAKGTYHDMGAFVSGVAGLPRIVTLHDFEIKQGSQGNLTMDITAKTYRYRDDGEAEAQKNNTKKRKQR